MFTRVLHTRGDELLTRSVTGNPEPVSYTHLRAHETPEQLVCRLLLEKKKSIMFTPIHLLALNHTTTHYFVM